MATDQDQTGRAPGSYRGLTGVAQVPELIGSALASMVCIALAGCLGLFFAKRGFSPFLDRPHISWSFSI